MIETIIAIFAIPVLALIGVMAATNKSGKVYDQDRNEFQYGYKKIGEQEVDINGKKEMVAVYGDGSYELTKLTRNPLTSTSAQAEEIKSELAKDTAEEK